VAHAVGASLADLATGSQVLVVTHLAQVAAYAHSQVVVTKDDDGTVAVARVHLLDDAERVVELSRMLSGSPDSGTAREHAAELLAVAAAARDA
jgi:DNA repair protein RecN (Recombination protein N)